jgi:hypothetical protein
MRIIFTLACIYLFALSSKAQFSKGTNQLSGYLGFTTVKSDGGATDPDKKTKYFSFSPAIGHFYRNNRLAGLQLYFGGSYVDGYPAYNSVGGSLFLRQYAQLGKSDFFVYAHERAGLTFGRSSSYFPQGYVRTKSTVVFAGVSPGMSYAVSKRLLIDLSLPDVLSLQYERSKPTDKSVTEAGKTSSFGISTGLSTGITSFGIGGSWAF